MTATVGPISSAHYVRTEWPTKFKPKGLPTQFSRDYNQALVTASLHAELQAEIEHHEEDVPCVASEDGDLWTSDDQGERQLASMACSTCPIIELCATVAELAQESWGVWGGVDVSMPRVLPVKIRYTPPARPKPRPPATHCKRGHEFTDANTIRRADGSRGCRECNSARNRERRAQQRAAA